jgi:hypothetical protein
MNAKLEPVSADNLAAPPRAFWFNNEFELVRDERQVF